MYALMLVMSLLATAASCTFRVRPQAYLPVFMVPARGDALHAQLGTVLGAGLALG
jgi:hypothetical protein